MEKNLTLEDQIIHILQQNEDLKVRIDNCQTLIQYVLHSVHEEVLSLLTAAHYAGLWRHLLDHLHLLKNIMNFLFFK